ncbi:MAG: rhodanese-like domain-containing protein [Clostridiales bacterium]|nr:rhodanese-like domain-containing protein [Clostridiales bacterium]
MAGDRKVLYEKIIESGDFADVTLWGDYIAALSKDKHSLSYTYMGSVWVDIRLDTFEESDIDVSSNTVFTINDIEGYGGQLYAACDGGLVIVITDCQKCYKLKKVCDFDINEIIFSGTQAEIYGKEGECELLPVNVLRQNKIDPSEVINMTVNGAILIDVRDRADFEAESVPGSVNIPIDEIECIKSYPGDSVLIFCCYSGGRSERAVKTALEYGFVNVYNAGGFKDILSGN